MGQFVVGDVVAIPFPFSDLSGKKLRPAVVVATVENNDLILCQITSKSYASQRAIAISDADFSQGGLPLASYIRPDKIFTAEATIIQKHLGRLTKPTISRITNTIQSLFVHR